jgi:tripartite-type tricarboxylate transporter receptor subunit TctC
MLRYLSRSWLVVALACLTGAAGAQDYPSRPVTVVVPWNAGGNIDIVARVVAQAMQKQTGRTFLVENAPGAGSMIGTARVAAAKPDGYTLLWGTSSGLVILPHINANVKYHPANSFDAISWVGSSPYILVVASDSPYRNYRELLNQAKANPGKLSYGTPGTGSSPHVTNEAMLSAVQARALHVPFKGSQDMINAVLRRDIEWIFDLSSGLMPMIKAGKFRPLGVTSAKRLAVLPDVPTMREDAELSGFESLSWIGLFAPKGTAPEQIRLLNGLAAKALRETEVVSALAAAGFSAEPSTPAELGESVRREYDKWGEVIRRHNIRID